MVVFLLLERIIRNRLIAAACALLLGFSEIFWSQSIVAEVYTLNAFFVALLLYLLLAWTDKRKPATLQWFAFLYGLSVTNHTMMLLFGPVFLIYIFWREPGLLRSIARLGQLLLLFFAGTSLYLWMMIRSLQLPLYNASLLDTFPKLFAHIGRLAYADLQVQLNASEKIGLVINFIAELGNQFFYSGLLLAIIGLVYLFWKNRSLGILTAGIFLCNSILIIYLRSLGWGIGVHYTYRFYYIPAFMIVVLWLGICLRYLLAVFVRLTDKINPPARRAIISLFYIVVFSLPISFLIFNYDINNQRDFWYTYDYSRELLESLEPNAVYYFTVDGTLQADTELFSLMYLKMVEGLRPDVRIVTSLNIFYRDVQFNYPAEFRTLGHQDRRRAILDLLVRPDQPFPVYTNFAVPASLSEKGYTSVSNGLAHRLYPSLAEAKAAVIPQALPPVRGYQKILETDEFIYNDLIAHHLFSSAAYYLAVGDQARQEELVIAAVQKSNYPFSQEFQDFKLYRSDWMNEPKTEPSN
jgi:hypothetical protein